MGRISLNAVIENTRPYIAFFDSEENLMPLPTEFAIELLKDLRISPKSIPQYVGCLRMFIDFLINEKYCKEPDIELFLKSTPPSVVNLFLVKCQSRGLAPSTIFNRDSYLKAFFNWLHSFKSRRGASSEENPYFDGLNKTPRPYRKTVPTVTYKKVVEFLNNCFETEQYRAMVHFMFDTGVRASEVGQVLLSDLPNPNDYPEEFIFYPFNINGVKGRGGTLNKRLGLISKPALLRTLRLYNNWSKHCPGNHELERARHSVFLNKTGHALNGKAVTNLMYYHNSKFLKDTKAVVGVTAHMLRHGAAQSIMASDLGKDLMDNLILVSKTFGHKQLRTSEVYAPYVQQAIKNISSNAKILSRYEEAAFIVDQTQLKFNI